MKQSTIWHFDEQGKLLAKYLEESPILQFGSIIGGEVVYLLPRSSQIGWLSVDGKDKKYIAHRYLSDSLYMCKLWFFADSIHYCIQERTNEGNYHRLTFLKHPGTIVHSLVVDNSGDFTFQPINHTNKFAYYCKLGGDFEIHIVDFIDKITSSFVFKRPEAGGCNTLLRSVQEITNDELLLLCNDGNLNYSCMLYNQQTEKLRLFGGADFQPLKNIFDVKVNGPYVYFYCYDVEEPTDKTIKNTKPPATSEYNPMATGTVHLFTR